MKRWTLKEARTRKGLSQAQLSELADIDQPNISAIERGVVKQPHLATMEKLANALDMVALCSVAGLVFEEKQS